MIHNISRFIAALALLATAQGAWATNITTHITYAGLSADDVTFTLSGNGTSFELKDGETKSVGEISGFNENFTITCSSALNLTSVSYSGEWEMSFWGTPSFNKNSNNGCTFEWGSMYGALTLNINVSYSFTGYTVHFEPNVDGNGTMSDQAIATGVATALSPCTFTHSFGKPFMAWSTSADGSGTAYADQQSVTDLAATGQTVTLYALWDNGFFVHFDANGGTGTMSNQFITASGNGYLKANAFTRTGYVFTGWNTASDGSGTAYADGKNVYDLLGRGQTLTLYAQWVAYYTVHFNANGGSGTMSDQTIGVGQAQALTANTFTRDGYYFAGWNTQANGTGTTYNDGHSVTDLAAANETFNLYAQWREPVTADYVDASGDAHTLTDCKEITPDHMPTTLAGNYIVSENVTYTSKVTISGNTTIILANGKTMSIGTEAAPLGGDYALYASGTNSLTIYGQSLDYATAGSLEVYSSGYSAVKLYDGSYTQHSGNVVVSRSGGSNNNSALDTGGSVTIDGGKLDASINSEGSFAINANGNISISGGSVTANATGADSYGMRSGGNITLTWTRATDRITASNISTGGGTVAVADGKKLHNGTDYLGGTLGDPATALNGKTLRPAATATYTTADGTAATADAILLDASDNSLPAGNYLATGTLNYTHGITLTGNVTLILADNCHMNVGTSGERISGTGIDGLNSSTYDCYDLEIFGQSNGTGTLSVYTSGNFHQGIRANALTINGGNITADTDGDGAYALLSRGSTTALNINGGNVTATTAGNARAIATNGNFYYNGGNVTATAPNSDAIFAGGNYTFSWRTPADRITLGATGLHATATKTATFARLFTDAADNYYGGTYTGDALNALAGKTLSGTTEVTLTEDNATQALAAINGMSGIDVNFNRAFTANVASTICLPFAISADQATAAGNFYTFAGVDTSGSDWVVTMQEANATNAALAANTPYLFMPSSSSEVTFSGSIGNVADTYTAGTTTSDDWTYKGTYETIEWKSDPGNIYGFASGQAYGNTSDQTEAGKFIRVHTGGIRPFRAYLKYAPSASGARALSRSANDGLPDTMTVRLIGSNGQTTAISTLDTRTGDVTFGDEWYTLDGRRLPAKPTAKGLYINKGNKVFIK